MASELEMKCSSRNAPIGTIPLRECRRRRKKELPSPARSAGTPLATWIEFLETGLADEATTPTPYDSRGIKANQTLSNSQTTQVKKTRNNQFTSENTVETLSALRFSPFGRLHKRKAESEWRIAEMFPNAHSE